MNIPLASPSSELIERDELVTSGKRSMHHGQGAIHALLEAGADHRELLARRRRSGKQEPDRERRRKGVPCPHPGSIEAERFNCSASPFSPFLLLRTDRGQSKPAS